MADEYKYRFVGKGAGMPKEILDRDKMSDATYPYPESNMTQPCAECGSYGFHETSCGHHPNLT